MHHNQKETHSHAALNRQHYRAPYDYPVKAVQIGEGNFIRAFVDWMVDQCNLQGVFKGTIAATQPREQGAPKLQKLRQQDGLFTLVSRGLVEGQVTEEHQVVSSISKTIDPYQEWEAFLSLADDPHITYVFSNTTEAGVTYQPEKGDMTQPIHSYPGKLTALLYRRYNNTRRYANFKGLTIVPCELLERAGDDLRDIVLQHAKAWELDEAFHKWVQTENVFLNSIVDRIVTGYPHHEESRLLEQLGYHDALLTVAEPYYQWVIEGDEDMAKALPFHEAGLNVKWVPSLSPYIKRKVRILNGAHTWMVPIAFLHGHDTVREAMDDIDITQRLEAFLTQNVRPLLPFPQEEVDQYIRQTYDRFRNPYLHHRLLDIAMNSTTKFCTRLLPTLIESVEEQDTIPDGLLTSLAYFILFYRCEQNEDGQWIAWRWKDGVKQSYELKDAESALTTFETFWHAYDRDGDINRLVESILSSSRIWPTPLSKCGLSRDVLKRIYAQTAQKLQALIEESHNHGAQQQSKNVRG
ncbi:tagaturonate reductase [Caldalkalibacillus salinus]|uniref:tagaturonate reductase n=1 Tax=Caldalkalibacillus salinus TaxID=2803787 RepID=UPI00192261F6